MPCHSAMTKTSLSVSGAEEVGKVLAKMKKAKTRHACVLNEEGGVEGLFSLEILLKSLLPVSVAMSDGVQLDITVRAAPGIAKRLKKVYPLPVFDFVERKVNAIHPETPTWEGVNFLITHGAPLVVVDSETGKFMGFMTEESAFEELERLKDSES